MKCFTFFWFVDLQHTYPSSSVKVLYRFSIFRMKFQYGATFKIVFTADSTQLYTSMLPFSRGRLVWHYRIRESRMQFLRIFAFRSPFTIGGIYFIHIYIITILLRCSTVLTELKCNLYKWAVCVCCLIKQCLRFICIINTHARIRTCTRAYGEDTCIITRSGVINHVIWLYICVYKVKKQFDAKTLLCTELATELEVWCVCVGVCVWLCTQTRGVLFISVM